MAFKGTAAHRDIHRRGLACPDHVRQDRRLRFGVLDHPVNWCDFVEARMSFNGDPSGKKNPYWDNPFHNPDGPDDQRPKDNEVADIISGVILIIMSCLGIGATLLAVWSIFG